MAHHHASRRIGVGNFSVAASRPFNRRFFDSLDRHPVRPRRVAAHLTFRLGDLPIWSAFHLNGAAS